MVARVVQEFVFDSFGNLRGGGIFGISTSEAVNLQQAANQFIGAK